MRISSEQLKFPHPESFDMMKNMKNNKEKTGKIKIAVNGPAERGAPQPKHDPKKVNEAKFRDEERGKEWHIELDFDNKICEVEWLSQESGYDSPSSEFIEEIQRAFIANGATLDFSLTIKFGSRTDGYVYEKTEKLDEF